MTSYSHEVKLNKEQVVTMLEGLAEHIRSESYPIPIVFRGLVEKVLSSYDYQSKTASMSVMDGDFILLKRITGNQGFSRSRMKMASTSSSCWPDGVIPADAFEPINFGEPDDVSSLEEGKSESDDNK